MIHIRSHEEIELIRKSALMVSATLTEVAKILKPGMKTIEIDRMAEQFIRDNGGEPSFKGYHGFKYSLCISPNEVVVHGFPGDYELKDGDILSVDCGVYMNGYHGDSAYTFAIGDVKPEVLQLLKITKESLYRGVEQAANNNRVGDISYAVENFTNKIHGYGVVRELVGHGVGKRLHEDPQVPNYGRRGEGKRLKEGIVIAIEPMINLGVKEVYTMEDGWTIVTADHKPSAHFEHTTAVRKGKGEALSSFAPIEAAEQANKELNSSYYAAEATANA
ncbi:type I methionyl aminopeptidase [Taibaiella soli]|uniref:Methionine aminopeptidase n=1 Tax=Taibaiella soli TaxID=1649169 RepID=A0A2W2B496_9BACT|nr:type I methionyl aminopeptidase [Taibaiella soli]PZF70957.1 type I methionyl aminopeptidase [Taibaiella soli]